MEQMDIYQQVQSLDLEKLEKKQLIILSGRILDTKCKPCKTPNEIKEKYGVDNEAVRTEIHRHCIHNCSVGKALGLIGLYLTDDYEVYISEQEKDILARNLKFLRKLHGYQVSEVARKIGLDYRYYHKYENSLIRANLKNLKKISAFYNIPVRTLHTELLENKIGQLEFSFGDKEGVC